MGVTDDQVLLALEVYQRAADRVAHDFAQRGATIEPQGVDLGFLDAIVVRYRQRGRTDVSILGTLPLVTSLTEATVVLADVLQEKELEAGANTWPGCLPGHAHPPKPAVVSSFASWLCPSDDVTLSLIAE
jgi:hypothetical protein